MLINLTIENFALIEKCYLEFNTGMTVITGETGAGKSIILEALSLLLGARAESHLIRHGSQKCLVSALFDIANQPAIQDWLEQKGFQQEESHDCFLKREINLEGRTRNFINQQPVSVQLLKELGEMLVTLHGQHAHQALLSRETHREWLDYYCQHDKNLLQSIYTLVQDYKSHEKELLERSQQVSDRTSRMAFLTYQLKEFSDLSLNSLTSEKIDYLESEFKSLMSLKNHTENYQSLSHLLEESLLPLLNKAKNCLPKSNPENPSTLLSYFETAEIQLKQALLDSHAILEQANLDPENLASLENQLDKIFDLSRKHHVKPNQLPELCHKLQQDLNDLESLSDTINALHETQRKLKKNYETLAAQLSKNRQHAAKKMTQEIEHYLKELCMEQAKLSLVLTPVADPSIPTLFGAEKVEFLVSANPGQPAGPLSKIASGGELSRISLAIELVAAKNQLLPVLIFDEVDTGISGKAAIQVGKLLNTLSEKAQVICITHLPQIAAKASHHLCVEKKFNTKKDQTLSTIKYLTPQEKVEQIAKLLGGDAPTKKALLHAKELLDS